MRIGIDPGITGAIAVLDDAKRFIEVIDMPVVTLTGNSQKVNGSELAKMFGFWQKKFDSGLTVFIERVHTMPGQGVVSSGNFMLNFGIVLGVLESMSIAYYLVNPQSWKKRACLPRRKKDQDYTAYKDMSRALAQQLFPQASLARKKDDGRSDALLIARFGELDKLL